ncbi:phosphocholine-specific phospholipase C [Peterkaempfera sp. SMS 1(5)a]|uniref:phosphocholine-specific phospholipase C n=1 Tax=Peterkaempfera podocarpi TaxID=3232308 RepID=UPI00366D0590
MTPLSRRSFVVAAAGATAAAGLPGMTGTAEADSGDRHPRGSVHDVKHVVILMQENRSFDHYLGALNGVRGFDDKQGVVFPNGNSVFQQPDGGRAEGYSLPFRFDTSAFKAQDFGGLDHGWSSGHQAVNHGAQNGWVAAKGHYTMGYFTREDIPFQYAMADAFTVCDQYFTSLNGPTDPNRLYLWTGTPGPGTDGTTGPFIDNSIVTENPVGDWTTYAERLEKAGISWRVYHNPDGSDDENGDYDDNALSYFKQFAEAPKDSPLYVNAMTKHDLTAFDEDCRNNELPTVSWLVAPFNYCEHPSAGPDWGAWWVNQALQSLMSNKEVWKNTVFLVMYDENDGFFDHVVPPYAEAGTEGEFVDGQPIGLGSRVPMWVCSPWSRGGWVNSQVFDHTSVLRFLEQVTGVHEPNISAWRRAVCGDLTTCFDFSNPDYSIPKLPDTDELKARATAQHNLPAVQAPADGKQKMPQQEAGDRPHRNLPYRPFADVTVDRRTGKVTCTMVNDGSVAYVFTVLPNIVHPFSGSPFLVQPRSSRTYVWDTTATDGRYDFSLYGADGFVSRFSGTVVPEDQTDVALPSVTADLRPSGKPEHASVELRLVNDGDTEVTFAVTANDFSDDSSTVQVGPRSRKNVSWKSTDGRYDFTVTASTGTRFVRRYAGTVHEL